MKIKEQVNALKDELIRLRRDFHMHPELGFEVWRTAKVVAEYLEDLGLEVKSGIAKTGVVGLLRGKGGGRTILLRADMDALPIPEENEVSYKSMNEGSMHACGHDGHMAMLLIAAKILSQHKDEIKGNIKFLFEPNEEDEGAKFMIEEGVMEDPHVDAALGIHLWTSLESGKMSIAGGPVMGAGDIFKLTIAGREGHTGFPQLAIDPIIAAANVVTATQSIQTREVDPLNPVSIIFARIEGGTALVDNIIPSKVELAGYIRHFYENGEEARKMFERIIDGVCQAYRTKYQLKITYGQPVLNNNPKMAELVRNIAGEVVSSPDAIVSEVRTIGGDDFSEFTTRVPGVYYFIGTGNKAKGTDFPHHCSRFNIDEDTLAMGVEMHVKTALACLSAECI